MHNKIDHLYFGNLVIKSIGYSENDGKYTFSVGANFGDLYDTNGTSKNLLKIKFDKDKIMTIIELRKEAKNISYSELSECLYLINLSWRS